MGLTDRENMVLVKRYNGCTFRKIGLLLDVSSERARQIYHKAHRKAQAICEVAVKEALGLSL